MKHCEIQNEFVGELVRDVERRKMVLGKNEAIFIPPADGANQNGRFILHEDYMKGKSYPMIQSKDDMQALVHIKNENHTEMTYKLHMEIDKETNESITIVFIPTLNVKQQPIA